jgi:hypothetical protein
MADTAPSPNNRTVVYRGRAERERPRMSGFAASPLRQSNGAGGDGQMPWSGKSFASRHNKKLSGAGAAKAAEQANAILRSGADEGVAIAVANKRANMMRKRGNISGRAASSTGLDRDRDVDAATA